MRPPGTLDCKGITLDALAELVLEQPYLHLELYVLLEQLIPALLQLQDALEHTGCLVVLIERLQYLLFAELAVNYSVRAAIIVGLKAFLVHLDPAPLAFHCFLGAASVVKRQVFPQKLLPAPITSDAIVSATAFVLLVVDQLDQSPAQFVLALQLSNWTLLIFMKLNLRSVKSILTVLALN